MSHLGLLDIVQNPKKDIVDGPFGSNMKSSDYTDSGVPVIKLQNIKVNYFLEKNISFVTEKKALELARHSYQSGDIIITKLGDPLGVACIMPENFPKGVIVADLIRLRPDYSKVDAKFLCYQLNSPLVMYQFKELTKGTTRPRVNLTLVRQIKVWIPDSDKQKKVTAKIDALFADIDSGCELLKDTKEKLESFKQSILNSAIRGKLVSQDPNDEPASVLLEKILVEKEALIRSGKIKKEKIVFSVVNELPFELPNNWNACRLKTLCLKITDGEHFRPKTIENGVMFLSAKDVRENRVSLASPLYIDNETAAKARLRCDPEKNDVLIVSRGATVGRSCIVDVDEKFCLLGSVILLKFSKNVDSEFFLYLFKTEYYRRALFGLSSSTAQQAIYLRDLKEIIVPIPPILEQRRIVKKIKKLFAYCVELENQINQSKNLVKIIESSILKCAFEGKLI